MKHLPRKLSLSRAAAAFVALIFSCGLGSLMAAGRIVVVDTADNASPAGDGKTSLLEALQDQLPDDVIRFNLAGAGPHLIKTPLGGYPVITEAGVTIDGYSQPGATPNTRDLLGGNDAKLAIYLDSTEDISSGNPAKPLRNSTRLPFPGYGDSENAILGVLGADHVRIKGLGFLARQTEGSSLDPSIYCVALVNGAEDCRVQGCRFGLDPDGATVRGGSAAIAGFRHRVTDDQENTVDTFSRGLVFGTDGDGVGDVGEFNVTVGMHIALALELPGARISGNYFNVLPDGKTFVDVNDIHQSLLAVGRTGGDASVENIENGRFTEGTVIGTDGDGLSDANERNVFNTVYYGHLIEFYSNAKDVVVAGNYFGVGVDGVTRAPVAGGDLLPDLIALSGSGNLRLGSDGDGRSDALEGNLIVGIPGSRLVDAASGLRIFARRNAIVDSGFTGFPFADGSANGSYADYYADVLVDAANPLPVITSFANGVLVGTLPPVLTEAYPLAEVDVYLLDSASAAKDLNLPGTYLTSFRDNGPTDTDAAVDKFSVALTGGNIPPGSKVVLAVSYSQAAAGFIAIGLPVTGPLSAPFAAPGSAAGPALTAPVVTADGLVLSWTGGTGPFLVQGKLGLADAWIDLKTTTERSATIPLAGPSGFFRVSDGTAKTVKLFKASLNGANERPTPVTTAGTGTGLLALDGLTVTYVVSYQGLTGAPVAYHLHGLGTAEQAVGVKFGLVPAGTPGPSGLFVGQATVDQATADGIAAGQTYFNLHTAAFGGGEIRGQVVP